MKKTTKFAAPLSFGEAETRLGSIVSAIRLQEDRLKDALSAFSNGPSDLPFEERHRTVVDFKKALWFYTPHRAALMPDYADYEKEDTKYRYVVVASCGGVTLWVEHATKGWKVDPEKLLVTTYVENNELLIDSRVHRHRVEANIALTKSDDVIAKEIIRRVLPGALSMATSVRAIEEAHEKYINGVKKSMDRAMSGIEAGVGYLRGDQMPGGRRAPCHMINLKYGAIPDNVYLGREVTVGEDYIRFDSIGCPPEVANKILKLLLKQGGKG